MIEVEEGKLHAAEKDPEPPPSIASRSSFLRLWSLKGAHRAAPVHDSTLDSTLEVGVEACPCVCGRGELRASGDGRNGETELQPPTLATLATVRHSVGLQSSEQASTFSVVLQAAGTVLGFLVSTSIVHTAVRMYLGLIPVTF